MTFVDVLILSVVEGLTEFIPVSSTGHLMIAGSWLGLPSSTFLSSFNIVIQLGAILAVLVLYGKKLLLNKNVLIRIGSAFVPTALIGFLLYKIIKTVFLVNVPLVAGALVVGGVLLLIFEYWYEEKETDVDDIENISIRQAIYLGLFQALAVVPGVSRSGATIVGGMLLRLKRKTMVEFTFLLAIPTMMSASAYDLLKSGGEFSIENWQMLALGFGASFLVSLLSIKWFLAFVSKYTFSAFGVYRIVVGLLVFFFLYF
jgi:undecaprenyl-diphosphatase